jgi:basic membrane lipoprotein Med (substrate-binding protein (PBP1-ABC) superfamily)
MSDTMRRSEVTAVVGLVALVLLVAGCGPRGEVPGGSFKVTAISSESVAERRQQAARLGLERIAREFDADVTWLPVQSVTEGRRRLVAQGREPVDLVFGFGSYFEQIVSTEAAAYPETVFVVVPGRSKASNVGSIVFVPEEVGYVAGATAAAVTTSRKIGVVRGGGQPWLEPLEDGFATGFGARRRRSVVEVREGPAGVLELSSEGVEVALYATDRAQPEVLAAARKCGLLLVVTEPLLMASAPDVAFASIRLDVQEAMVRVAREALDGAFAGRIFTFDLGSGVLDVEINDASPVELRSRAREALEEARAEVTAGLVEFDEFGL